MVRAAVGRGAPSVKLAFPGWGEGASPSFPRALGPEAPANFLLSPTILPRSPVSAPGLSSCGLLIAPGREEHRERRGTPRGLEQLDPLAT